MHLCKGLKIVVMSNLGEENNTIPRRVVNVDELNACMNRLKGLEVGNTSVT